MEQLGDVTDRLAIQDLNQKYAVHVDLHEIDAWVELFTPDAMFDEREFGTPLMTGHEEIRAYGQQLAATVQHALHHMTTHVITNLTATSARGLAQRRVPDSLPGALQRSLREDRRHVAVQRTRVEVDDAARDPRQSRRAGPEHGPSRHRTLVTRLRVSRHCCVHAIRPCASLTRPDRGRRLMSMSRSALPEGRASVGGAVTADAIGLDRWGSTT
jgi:hypothetical protein